MAKRKCYAGWCDKPARWAPDYSALAPVFCTQRCAAQYVHELIAPEVEAEEERAEEIEE